jgi:site-specific DNA recombinase
MIKRAVLYARVSGDDRGKDRRNLAGQLDMCREYALSHVWHIVAELPEDDRGASGASFDLPQLNRALDMARAGEFDILVVRELDRFARGLAKQLIVESEFKRAGVQIEYVLGEYPDTPEGNLMKNVRAVVAEYERLKINERMVRGRRLKVKNGEIMLHGNRPPYGYRISEDGKSLVIYEPEARIVRLIFTWYAEGDENGKRLGANAIACRLTEIGVPTWRDTHKSKNKTRGYGEWSYGTISHMLSNEAYAGLWHYGRRKGKTEMNPRSHWLTVKISAIISRELWEKTQARRADNKAMAKRNTRYKYLMGRRATCGICGSKVHGAPIWARITDEEKRLYLYYHCAGRAGQILGVRCDLPYFRADHVDAIVWEWVKSVLSEPAALMDMLNTYQEEQEKANKPLIDRLNIIDGLIASNQVQLERLLDLYLAADFPKDMLVDRKSRLESTIEALEKERVSLVAHLDGQKLTEDQTRTLQDFAERVADGLEQADQDFEARCEIIDALGLRVTLTVEDGENVVYVHCILDNTVLSVTDSSTGITSG